MTPLSPTKAKGHTTARSSHTTRTAFDGAKQMEHPVISLQSKLLLGGTLIVAASLRYADLGGHSLTFDEIYVVKIVLSRWQDLFSVLRTAEFHPPLYYLLMKMWIGIAGLSDATLRIPSASFSLASVILTYLLLRRVAPESVSLMSAFFVAVSPFEVMAAQEARMYALLTALTLASTVVLSRSVEEDQTVRWVAYSLLAAAIVYTQYLGIFVLIAHGAWVVWFERAHLRKFSAAMIGAALLYLPWVPSLLTQLGHSPVGGLEQITVRDVSHLFGLFSFGGSLFGMPSYTFNDTPLGLVEESILLAPFLLVIWCGAASMLRDRRRLAFLGLPFLVPIGATLIISTVRPFFARWLSFVVPFYAAFVAQGVLDVGERFRDHCGRVAAGLLAGLLLYSVPVLGRYYRDPNFFPFQWREQAALVRKQVEPGDGFLFGTATNAIAFTYYFGVSQPQMVLFPNPDFAAVRQLGRHRRVWLVVAPPFGERMLVQTLPELQRAFVLVGHSPNHQPPVFPMVYLFQPKGI